MLEGELQLEDYMVARLFLEPHFYKKHSWYSLLTGKYYSIKNQLFS